MARAEVNLGSEVDLFGGLVGSLKNLHTRSNGTRVAEGVWFSTLSSGDFQGRKLLDPDAHQDEIPIGEFLSGW